MWPINFNAPRGSREICNYEMNIEIAPFCFDVQTVLIKNNVNHAFASNDFRLFYFFKTYFILNDKVYSYVYSFAPIINFAWFY